MCDWTKKIRYICKRVCCSTPKGKTTNIKEVCDLQDDKLEGMRLSEKGKAEKNNFCMISVGRIGKQARVTGVKLVKSVKVKVSIQGMWCCVSEGTELQLASVSPGRLVCSTMTRLTNTVLSTWMLLKVDHRYFHRKTVAVLDDEYVSLLYSTIFLCIMPKTLCI